MFLIFKMNLLNHKNVCGQIWALENWPQFSLIKLGRQPLGIQTSRITQGGHTKHRREWNTRTVPGYNKYSLSFLVEQTL